MFDSGIPASSLISTLKAEVDVAIPISNGSYVDSLNSLEQLLYTEVIKEQKAAYLDEGFGSLFLDDIPTDVGEKQVVSEDVYTVFCRNSASDRKYNIQMKKTTLTTSAFINHTWYIYDSNSINIVDYDGEMGAQYKVVYFVRPALKTVNENDEVGTGNVMLPVEFIDLAKAKLRADAYKIANEDSLAAKWMNDYNVLLETFKEWVDRKKPHFGM